MQAANRSLASTLQKRILFFMVVSYCMEKVMFLASLYYSVPCWQNLQMRSWSQVIFTRAKCYKEALMPVMSFLLHVHLCNWKKVQLELFCSKLEHKMKNRLANCILQHRAGGQSSSSGCLNLSCSHLNTSRLLIVLHLWKRCWVLIMNSDFSSCLY